MTGPVEPTAPSPSLTPEQVVCAQLAAFAREPYGADPQTPAGEGLTTAFAFASPGNRAATGPLSRFSRMLRHDAYGGLLGHRAVQLGPLVERGDSAQVEVLVITADDRTEGYTWVLGRQDDPPWAGCWMTDGVVRHEDGRP